MYVSKLQTLNQNKISEIYNTLSKEPNASTPVKLIWIIPNLQLLYFL